MKKIRSFPIALLALSIGVSGLALAEGRDRDREPSRRDHRQVQRDSPPPRQLKNWPPSHYDKRGERRADQRGSQPYYQANPGGMRGNPGYNQRGEWRDRSGEWRGAGPSHDMRRGGYLTPQYRSYQYVVDDWRGHRLNPPPRGYHWVQAGGDYVLAAIATGLILEILLNY